MNYFIYIFQIESLAVSIFIKYDQDFFSVMDITLTPSPWTTLMDYPNGLS